MGAALAVSIIAAKEREIVDAFRDAGATSPQSARSTLDIGVDERIAFRRLRRHEIIRETTPGVFYLDEQVLHAVKGSRVRLLIVMVVVLLVLIVGLGVGFFSLT